MVYSDIEKFGFIGIIPKPKTKSGEYSKQNKSVRKIVIENVKNNKDFVQFALKEKGAQRINEILGGVVEFIIRCNEAYYYYKDLEVIK